MPSVSALSSRFSSEQTASVPVHAHHRIAADLQMQVGGSAVRGGLQKIVNMHQFAARGSRFALSAFATLRRAPFATPNGSWAYERDACLPVLAAAAWSGSPG